MEHKRGRNRGESKEKTHIYTDFYKIKLQENENQKGKSSEKHKIEREAEGKEW